MDYKYPLFGETEGVKVNRVCTRCGAHWFGKEGEVKQYTSKEWDALLEAALKDEQ